MADLTPGMIFTDILRNKKPEAVSWVGGNTQNPQLSGVVQFFETPYQGVLIEAEIFGLPNIREKGSSDFYAMPDDFKTQPAGDSGMKIGCGVIRKNVVS